MSTQCQIWLWCMCWHLTVPNRYIDGKKFPKCVSLMVHDCVNNEEFESSRMKTLPPKLSTFSPEPHSSTIFPTFNHDGNFFPQNRFSASTFKLFRRLERPDDRVGQVESKTGLVGLGEKGRGCCRRWPGFESLQQEGDLVGGHQAAVQQLPDEPRRAGQRLRLQRAAADERWRSGPSLLLHQPPEHHPGLCQMFSLIFCCT